MAPILYRGGLWYGMAFEGVCLMGNVEKFPERGVLRDKDGNVVGAYNGMSKGQAISQMAHQARAMILANDIAVSRGYQSILDMPEAERMELVSETMETTAAANDETFRIT